MVLPVLQNKIKKIFGDKIMSSWNMTLRFYTILLIVLLMISCDRTVIHQNKTDSANPTVARSENEFTGKVVAIADGDTATILDENYERHKIRFLGIDAPEKSQAFGQKSKQNLSDLIFGRQVTVQVSKRDKYNREVAKVLLDGKDINLRQIKDGFAWHYKEYQREQTSDDRDLYAEAEDEAQSLRRGLWFDENPQKPSDFRREEKLKNGQ